MKKSNLLTELNLKNNVLNAQMRLYNFYVDKCHMSKRNSIKRAFNMTDREIDKNLVLLGKEQAYCNLLSRFEKSSN